MTDDQLMKALGKVAMKDIIDRVESLRRWALHLESSLDWLAQPPCWTGPAFPDCSETELEPTEWCSSCYAKAALLGAVQRTT